MNEISKLLSTQLPDKTSFDEAATFPITFTTACVGLFAPAPIGLNLNPTFSWDKLHKGESALVIGGSTSVGQFGALLISLRCWKMGPDLPQQSSFSNSWGSRVLSRTRRRGTLSTSNSLARRSVLIARRWPWTLWFRLSHQL